MALNIPNVGTGLQGLLQGVNSGSQMFSKIMNARQQNQMNQFRPSGDVANALYVEQLKNRFGGSDPRYLEAKRAHDMILEGRKSLIDYRDVLNQTAGIRATSPLGKLIQEGRGKGAIDMINANRNQNPSQFVEGTQRYNAQGEPVYDEKVNIRTPEEKQAYEQAISKNTTDAAIRNKIPFAENVKITMDNINPDDLVRFSGPVGTLRLGIEKLRAAKGNPSPEYLAYESAVTGADTLKKQLRQFWGDSIQPAATEQIGKLTNPSHWTKNPIVAKQQFEQLKKITDQELQSFVRHGTSPIKLNYDNKTGEFYTMTKESPTEKKSELQRKIESTANKKYSISQEDRNIAKAVSGQVIDVLPKATPEAIISTVQQSGKSMDEVIQYLVDQAELMRGGSNG